MSQTVVAAMSDSSMARHFPPEQRSRLDALGLASHEPLHDLGSEHARTLLAGAQVLLTSWGAPAVTPAVLDAAPHLRGIVHAAGTVKSHLGDDFWADPRAADLQVSSAAAINAVPVAQYTLANIILELKQVRPAAQRLHEHRRAEDLPALLATMGTYGRTVGIVGASSIGRLVIALLGHLDVHVLVHDPYLSAEQARELEVERVDRPTLAARSDLVTVHAPNIPETHHIIDAAFLAAMPDGATLINTARGALVDTEALTAEVVSGRLRAVLDVTDPEPLPPDSPLYDTPHAVLTPHVAGSLGTEVVRLGEHAIAEVARVLAGEPVATPVHAGMLARGA